MSFLGSGLGAVGGGLLGSVLGDSGDFDPTKYQELENERQRVFQGEQSEYYDENFAPLEKELALGNFDTKDRIGTRLLNFEGSQEQYKEQAKGQQNRFLSGFGLQTDPSKMSGRQASVLDNQKIFDSIMESGMRQGIRQGVTEDVSRERLQALSLGESYKGEQMQFFQMGAAQAQSRDETRQAKEQGKQAVAGAASGAISGILGAFSGGGGLF